MIGKRWLRKCLLPRLHSPHDNKDDEHDQQRPYDPTRTITPTGTVGPRWEGPDQQQDQNDQQYGRHDWPLHRRG